MTLEKLDNAIRELSEAKRLAKLFNWPESAVRRIDLVLRGAVHYRKEISEELDASDPRKENNHVSSAIQ